MKSPVFVLTACLTFALLLRAQDISSQDSSASPGPARILGPVPDGTPPPTEVQKAEYVVPQRDILRTVEHQQGGRTITLRQIKPINLPPPPAPSAAVAPDPEFTARLADYRENHPGGGLLILSATVYRSAESPPRTLVHYWPEGGGKTITFWSSADFSLIAGGIQSFVDSAGEMHSLIMGWGYVDIDHQTDLSAAKNTEEAAPEIPAFPQARATFQIDGKPPAAADLTAIQSLHDLYNSEHQRLLIAYQGREQSRLQKEAELKANPPRPKNITFIDPWTKSVNGQRIFPDFEDPTKTTIRHAVEVIVKTTPSLVGKAVFVKSFDVDDSTSEEFDKDLESGTVVIDENGKAGSDNYNDYLNTPQNGQFWSGTAWGSDTAQGVVDANGETRFILRVGMQPGNNYRVVATVIDEAMYQGIQTENATAGNYLGAEFSEDGGVPASPLLTVWRKLWVENDSMVAIPVDPEPYPYKRNDLSADAANPIINSATLDATGTGTIFYISPISDATSFLTLENGHIIVQSIVHPATGAGILIDDHVVSVADDYTSVPGGGSFSPL